MINLNNLLDRKKKDFEGEPLDGLDFGPIEAGVLPDLDFKTGV